ncbi:hypothetical protein GG851_10585 [Bordetella petrii]|nr:hypothetical protein [Bordetella petrii]
MALVIGTVKQAVDAGRRRSFEEGPFRGVADYLFETPPEHEPGPQALIARQARGWTLPVHFHMQHQFQVVLRGQGTLGKHLLAPGSVHYASPQSAYGPIVAGDDGLDYFTLRVLTDKGAWYMPESRKFMKMGMFKEQKAGAALRAAAAQGWHVLIPHRNDGLGAWAWVGEPGIKHALAEPISQSGRFYVAVRGSYSLGDRRSILRRQQKTRASLRDSRVS